MREESAASVWTTRAFVWLALFAVGFFTVQSFVGESYLRGFVALAVLAIGLPLAIAVLHGRRSRNERRLRSLIPGCLVCFYDLRGSKPEPDGCTVCPECGAAWNLTRGDIV